MPLRFIRIPVPRANSKDALQVVLSASALAKDLSSMAMFPPATALVSIVVLIIETVQSVQNNKEACTRLARRCARILLDINEQMDGRWDSAPSLLLRNLQQFELVLRSIQEFMKTLSDIKWGSRFLRKTSIENAIMDYSAQLDDASRSFQVATLINIHYAVAAQPRETKARTDKVSQIITSPFQDPEDLVPPPAYINSTPPLPQETIMTDNDAVALVPKAVNLEERTYIHDYVSDVFTTTLEDRGFRRYHQSEIQLKGASTFTLKDGWWAGSSMGEVDGRYALAKRYEGPRKWAMRQWLRDVKILQSIYHPNLPHLIGFSDENALTPFILLSNAQMCSPQNLLQFVIEKKGLAATLEILLTFYQDITDATLYVKQQLDLNEGKVQDFIEGASLQVDALNKIIVAPPLPRDGIWMTVRNYNLTATLTKTTMNLLPTSLITYHWQDASNNPSMSSSLNHIITLAKEFLPSERDPPQLSSTIQAIFQTTSKPSIFPGTNIELIHAPKPTLGHLHLLRLAAGGHGHAWSENQGVPADKFAVGDFGYIPSTQAESSGIRPFDSFIRLGNIFQDKLVVKEILETTEYAEGSCWNWKDIPIQRKHMHGYQLPGGVHCWPVAVPPYQQIDCSVFHSLKFKHTADAWKFLLEHAKTLAAKGGILPQDIMLITLSGKSQDFYIRDFHTPAWPLPHSRQHLSISQYQVPFHGPQQPTPFHQPNSMSSIVYLLTSRDSHPSWSHQPHLEKLELEKGWIGNIGWCHGYINWVQLHPDDFI